MVGLYTADGGAELACISHDFCQNGTTSHIDYMAMIRIAPSVQILL